MPFSPSLPLALVSPGVSNWLTPVWIMSLGVTTAVVALAVCLLLLTIVSPRRGRAAMAALTEGVMLPLLWVTAIFAIFGVLGWFLAVAPEEIITSLQRMPYVGEREFAFEIAPAQSAAVDNPQQTLEVDFRTQELRRLIFRSSVNLTVHTQAWDVEKGMPQGGNTINVIAKQDYEWKRPGMVSTVFGTDEVTAIYVVNEDKIPGTLDLTVITAPAHPEAVTAPITAIAVFSVFLLYLLQSQLFPKFSAVALATAKSELAQPLFWIIACVGMAAIVLFLYVPYNTFGEDIKMLKTSCFDFILVLSLVLAVWTASNSVSEEIEGRTALTVLCKPLSRWQFILGKFAGIGWTVFLLFVMLGAVFLVVVAYKPLYDSREMAYKPVAEGIARADDFNATWQDCHMEMVRTVPGLTLAFMEAMVLASVSLAISTRLPILANFIICFTVYALGNISPLIVQSSAPMFPPVKFVANLIATVLPVLDHFNVEAAISGGTTVPLSYLAMALVYCMLYSSIAMLVALFSFEDRDLA